LKRGVTLGAGGSIDTESLTSPVVGFILELAGLRQFEPERVEDQPSFGLRATLRDGARMWHYFSSLFYGRFRESKIAPIVFS
jgi:hypothetical protein